MRVGGNPGHTLAEVDREMKATSILLAAMAMAMAVVAAQPVNPVASFLVDGHAVEPAWMVLSGATLLALASAVRRYIP